LRRPRAEAPTDGLADNDNAAAKNYLKFAGCLRMSMGL